MFVNLNSSLLASIIGVITGICWQWSIKVIPPTILICFFCITLFALLRFSQKMGQKNLVAALILSSFFAGTLVTALVEVQALKTLRECHHSHSFNISGTICECNEEEKYTALKVNDLTITTHDNQKISLHWFTHAIFYINKRKNAPIGARITASNLFLKNVSEKILPYLLKTHTLGFFFPKKYRINTSSKITPVTRQILSNDLKNHFRINNLSTHAQALYSSIFLGSANNLTTHMRILFDEWGVSHYLARSGLHVIFLVSLLGFLFKTCGLPLWLNTVGMLVILNIYSAISTPSVSFLRAFWTCILIICAPLIGAPARRFHIFSLVTILSLLLNPFILFGVDFQLSFGISGALIAVLSIFSRT